MSAHVTIDAIVRDLPVIVPKAYIENTADRPKYIEGTLNFSKKSSAIDSRILLGIKGFSVSTAGCSSGLAFNLS